MANILYIHGMGGGGDSRIPSILDSALSVEGSMKVIVRTYDFDPEIAANQISEWVDETDPVLIIGESLGSIHALRIRNIPHLLISPSLNAPLFFGWLSWLTLLPGVTWIMDRIYRPREGDRQPLHFTFGTMKKYLSHRKLALDNSMLNGSPDRFFAFFGTRDHYRRTGIVSIRTWKKYFGETYSVYDGTHFTEEEYIYSLVIPKIREFVQGML